MFLEKGCCLNSFCCEPILEKFSHLKISCHYRFILSLNNLMDFHNSLYTNINFSVILSAEWRQYFFNNTSFHAAAASLGTNLIQLWRQYLVWHTAWLRGACPRILNICQNKNTPPPLNLSSNILISSIYSSYFILNWVF